MLPVTATTVDSTPTLDSPPSRISGRRPSISASVSGAFVGLGLPERFADGAANATPLCPYDLLHHRVGRHPHADGVKARAGHVADLGAAGHDHRQRAGPEGGSQLFGALGHLGDDAVQHLHAADMHNERVILRAALRFKKFFLTASPLRASAAMP